MTRQKSFKRLVRARMDKTGESYTGARSMLLAAEQPDESGTPALIVPDESIRERTGRGWEEWFDLLDSWGGQEMSHRDIARRVAEELAIEPLGWNAQAVTVSYERARGMRQVNQRADGFGITASKTVAVPVERLYDAVTDEARRSQWLPEPEDQLSERKATRPKSARYDWGDGATRVHVGFAAKGDDRSVATLEHLRLADKSEAEKMKAFWRERLSELKTKLEAGGSHT